MKEHPDFPGVPENDPFPYTHPNAQPRPALRAIDPNTASNAELDECIIDREREERYRKKRAALKYPVKTIQELSFKPTPKNWLVKGLLAQGETSAWVAPPGGMKSALMAELTMCVANQQNWHGRKVEHCFAVVYFALERADLVQRRLVAHCQRLGLNEDDMKQMAVLICTGMVDLTDFASVQHVVASVKILDEEYGQGPSLLVFDTFAKTIAAGGKDENSAADQGKVFANIQRIKDATDGPHVALIGHTGKDESRGARGSNAFYGDVDVMVEISGSEIKTATVTKANDMPEGPLFSFKSEVHEFGLDEDGDPITVNVVSAEEVVATDRPAEPRLTENQRVMFRLLHEAGAAGLATEEWSEAARAIGIEKKQRHYELRMALKDKAMVREYNSRWFVSNG
jgi:hypothetical protein